MMMKQAVLSIAMVLSTALSLLLGASSARAGPSPSSLEQNQWPMGSNAHAIVRNHLHAQPTRARLVVHKLTTWRTSASAPDKRQVRDKDRADQVGSQSGGAAGSFSKVIDRHHVRVRAVLP
jgi:hypothetical protein